MCYPDPPPPPRPGCIRDCVPQGRPVTTLSGSVLDARGTPIPGASVWWQLGEATVQSTGAFTIQVWADAPVDLVAWKAPYRFEEQRIAAPSALVPVPPFRLTWLANSRSVHVRLDSSEVTPAAFNQSSSRSLRIEMTSPAPQLGSKAVAEVPYGPGQTMIATLAFDGGFSSPSGWSSWIGTVTVPSSAAEGRHIIRACIVDAFAQPHCSQQVGSRLSMVTDAEYFLDSTAPRLSVTMPTAFANVISLSSVSSTLADDAASSIGSGVDPTSLSLLIDEQSVAGTANNATIAASVSLPPGVHLARVRGKDKAGNALDKAWLFTIVTLSATPAKATLREQTAAVDLATQSVRFVTPVVDVGSFDAQMNATTRVGRATVSRSIDFGPVSVEFKKPDGTITTANVTLPTASATSSFFVLTPSTATLRARINQSATSLADLVVTPPSGFTAAGTTATLKSQEGPLGVPGFVGDLVAAAARPEKAAITLSTCLTETDFCSPNGSEKHLAVYVDGGWQQAALDVSGPTDLDADYSLMDPGCRPLVEANACGQEPSTAGGTAPYACPRSPLALESTACGQSNLIATRGIPNNPSRSSSGAVGCGIEVFGVNQCSGAGGSATNLAALYSTPFVYSVPGCVVKEGDECAGEMGLSPTPATLAVWIQAHAAPGSISCPEGLGGTISSAIERLIVSIAPGPGYSLANISTITQRDSDWVGRLESPTFAIKHRINPAHRPPVGSYYAGAVDLRMGVDGTPASTQGVASVWWPSNGPVTASSDLSLYAGAELTQSVDLDASTSVNVIGVFILTYQGGCA